MSKICTEVLLKNPGIYLVFRAEGSSGIPKQAPWIDELVQFVFKSGIDELPADLSELENSPAKNFTPSIFLLALHAIIVRAALFTFGWNLSRIDLSNSKAFSFSEKLLINSIDSSPLIVICAT